MQRAATKAFFFLICVDRRSKHFKVDDTMRSSPRFTTSPITTSPRHNQKHAIMTALTTTRIAFGCLFILSLILSISINVLQSFHLSEESSTEMKRTISLLQHLPSSGARKLPATDDAVMMKPHRSFEAIPQRPARIQRDLVKPGDYIYYQDFNTWDASPVVIESHKLIFFTIPKVGCTVWKQLLRRMMGSKDWDSQDGTTLQPHNPKVNGLKYLYNYTIEEASVMMTSPEWTRAMMVRDPKERFLSAFLDKSLSNFHAYIIGKCCKDGSCVDAAQNLTGFLALTRVCEDEHWRPQNDRVDYKYWPYINYIGHIETAAADAESLLKKIGAWDEFGKTGWGRHHNKKIFATADIATTEAHYTWSNKEVWKWYTPAIEQQVERKYRGDYENPLFDFTQGACLTCIDRSSKVTTVT